MGLSLPADLAHIAAGGPGRLGFQQNVAGLPEVVLPLVAGGIVQAQDEVRLGRRPEAGLDLLPGRHQV